MRGGVAQHAMRGWTRKRKKGRLVGPLYSRKAYTRAYRIFKLWMVLLRWAPRTQDRCRSRGGWKRTSLEGLSLREILWGQIRVSAVRSLLQSHGRVCRLSIGSRECMRGCLLLCMSPICGRLFSLSFRLELHIDEFDFREILEPRTPPGTGTPQGRVQLGIDRSGVLIVNAIGL